MKTTLLNDYKISLALPIAVAVGLCLITGAFVIFGMPETKPKEEFPFHWKRANPFHSFGLLGTNQLTIRLAVVTTFVYFGLDSELILFENL